MVDAEQPDEVGAAALAELDEIGVIDDAGAVGVLEIDADREHMRRRPRSARRGPASSRSSFVAAVEQGELGRRLGRLIEAEMGEGLRRQHAAARGAGDEALLQQIGLDDLLDRVARL